MADATRLELPQQPRARRTHAQRTAETRAKILAAVVDSIAQVGYQATTAAEITRRSGVTWGAVQHHFGGKDGMLTAVLEDSFNRFAARIEEIPSEDVAIDERARLFVERAWEHFSSDHYRATFEILLCYMRREHTAADGGASWQARMTQAWDSVWSQLFAAATTSRRRSLMLQHYTVSVLSGLASTLTLEGEGAALVESELELLTRTLQAELAMDQAPRPS